MVNFAWNLGADLKELPGRMRDTRPRPWRVVHNAGGGDFYTIGETFFSHFLETSELSRTAHVLDIGCGPGRLAFPICAYLGAGGRYTGFDISKLALGFARRHLGGACAIDLVHADLASEEYTRSGANAAGYRFPVDDNSVDAALATSLFSHIKADVARAYLRQAGRVLAPGGRLMLTGFLVSQDDRAVLAQGRPRLALQSYGEAAFVADPRYPERAIGFDESTFLDWAAQAGLTLLGDISRGDWRLEKATGGEYQDRIVLQAASC